MGRRSVSVDESGLAIETCIARLMKQGVPFRVFSSGKKNAALRFTVSMEKDGADGYTVSLEKVEPGRNALRPEERDRERYDAAAEKDPVSIVSCWSLDSRFDGSVHCPTESAVRSGDRVPGSMKCGAAPGSTISVKVTDVLGNSGFSVFHLE